MRRNLPKPIVPVLEEDLPLWGEAHDQRVALLTDPPTEDTPRPPANRDVKPDVKPADERDDHSDD